MRDLDTTKNKKNIKQITLTNYQNKIFELLKASPEGIYKYDLIFMVYDYDDESAFNSLRQHIFQLNKKIKRMGIGKIVHIMGNNSITYRGRLVKLILNEDKLEKGNTNE